MITHFKNLAVFAARFLKCVGPFYEIAKQKVKERTWEVKYLK